MTAKILPFPSAADSEPDFKPCVVPPSMRSDAMRALELAMKEVDHAMRNVRERARELGLGIHARRVDLVRINWAEAAEELQRDPR